MCPGFPSPSATPGKAWGVRSSYGQLGSAPSLLARPQGGVVAPLSEVLSKAKFLSPGEDSGDQLASSL